MLVSREEREVSLGGGVGWDQGSQEVCPSGLWVTDIPQSES